MSYIDSLEKVQVGLEATYGDGAADTISLVGIENCQVTPHVDASQLLDKTGDTFLHNSYVTGRWSEGSLEGILNYDQAYILLDGVFGKATPAGDVRTYTGSPDWATEVEQSLAVYYGQDSVFYTVSGVLPYSLKLTGASHEPVRFSFPFFARAAAETTFSGIAAPEVAHVMGAQCELYIDAGLAATPGTTPVADTAFRFEAEIVPNRKPLWHLGDVEPDSYRNGKWAGSFKLILEATATTLGVLGDILDATSAAEGYTVRIRATNGLDILDLDFAGVALVPPVLIADDDGVVTVELNLVPQYNSAMDSVWAAELTIDTP